MKFALLNMDLDEQNVTGKAIVNIGSVAMRLAIKELLCKRMGIKLDEIIEIPLSNIGSYDGEYVIMPLNMHWMQDVGNKRLLSMSSRIIPVFLSVSLNDTELNNEQINFLKRYEPIGCRDDRTMNALRFYGIDAYVFGCLAGTFTDDNDLKDERTDIVFADVPLGVKKYIPDEFKGNIKYIKHELRVEEIPPNVTVEEYTKQIINYYKTKVKLVITSRFHGAVIPLAFNVPVIVINEEYTFRFSWLKKLIPFYTKESYNNIEWYPKPINFNQVKQNMISIAIKRINDTIDKYWLIMNQSYLLENSKDNNYSKINYYEDALEFIDKRWKKEDSFQYAFWGVNNNAEYIYNYINQHYPNAHLYEIYDSYKKIMFHGINSIKPDEIKKDRNIFIFVTTYVAGYFAKDLFDEKQIDSSWYYILDRKYITNMN